MIWVIKKVRRGMGYSIPFLFFVFLFSEKAEAAVEVIEIYDPFNIVISDAYYVDNGSYDSYQIDVSGTRAVSVTFTSYDETFTNVGSTKTYTREQYGWTHFKAMGFNCNVAYIGELHDVDGNLLVRAKMIITGLTKPACDSEPSGDMGSGECDICGIFDCPEWDNYMNKLDDIKNAIPPPPDWDVVSGKFSDAIVPRLVEESRVMLDDLLGRAPEPPTPPPSLPTMPDLPSHDDGGFKDREPEMQDSGVEGFDATDIKDQAPEMEYEEDPTGGFNLSVDPVESLPDVVPGGDPGPYKRDPVMLDAEYPAAPKESNVDIGKPSNPKDEGATPPIPGDSGGAPPIPGDSGGAPPIPGGSGGAPPIPGGGAVPPGGYMPKPKGG